MTEGAAPVSAFVRGNDRIDRLATDPLLAGDTGAADARVEASARGRSCSISPPPIARLMAPDSGDDEISVSSGELRRVGRELVADWQAEHGAFTAEELAAARAEMAAADAQALDASGPGTV